MAAKNGELRRSTGTTFAGVDQLVYLRSHVAMVDGLLVNNKFNEAYLPASAFGGSRLVTSITTGTTHDSTYKLGAIMATFIAANGGTPRGSFFLCGSNLMVITVSPDDIVHTEDGDLVGDGLVSPGTISLTNSDVLLCIASDIENQYLTQDGYEYSVIHNNQDEATTTVGGFMSATDKVKIDGMDTGAQKNSNITKAEIEAKLTGAITTHTHAYQAILSAGFGDTLNPYASKTAKFVLAAPNAANGVPSFRALIASDLPANYGDSLNPYASKTAKYILAAPNAAAGAPTFRALLASDLPADHGDTLNPYASKTAKFVLAAPNAANGVPSFRALLASDIPPLSYLPYVGGSVTEDISIGYYKLKYDAFSYIKQDGQIIDIVIDNEQAMIINDGGNTHNMKSRKLVNVTNPTAAQDAATKNYVDIVGGMKAYATVAEADLDIANNPVGKIALIYI